MAATRLRGNVVAPGGASLQAMSGANIVPMGGPNTPMTRDYPIDRATVLIKNGVVAQITCG